MSRPDWWRKDIRIVDEDGIVLVGRSAGSVKGWPKAPCVAINHVPRDRVDVVHIDSAEGSFLKRHPAVQEEHILTVLLVGD